MKLVDTVPVIEGGQYKLVGTTDGYEVSINGATWDVLRGMGKKSPGQLDERERFLNRMLGEKGRMQEGCSEMRLRGTEGLYVLGVETTDACNLRCKHCYLGEKAKLFLRQDAYESSVDDAVELGAYAVALTGGEALLDRSLFDKIKYARDRDCKVSLVTNATLIKEEHAKRFASLGMESMAVSLNGPKKEHEGLYGVDTYEPALRGLMYLIEAGNKTFVNFNVYEGNVHAIPEFEMFCKSIGVAGLNVSHIKPVGWGENMKNEIVQEGPRCCGKGGKEQVVIKADGRVVPCVFLNEQTMGSVYNERFGDIYRRHRSALCQL